MNKEIGTACMCVCVETIDENNCIYTWLHWCWLVVKTSDFQYKLWTIWLNEHPLGFNQKCTNKDNTRIQSEQHSIDLQFANNLFRFINFPSVDPYLKTFQLSFFLLFLVLSFFHRFFALPIWKYFLFTSHTLTMMHVTYS